MIQSAARPNSWVRIALDGSPALTYAPLITPSPLTVSLPGQPPTLGTLLVVISNDTQDDVTVGSIQFTIAVGKESTALTPSTDGIGYSVSDTTHWDLTGPPSPVTEGPAGYLLSPKTGSTVTVAAGDSLVVRIDDFATNFLPGTSTVTVQEVLGDGTVSFPNFVITTYPYGFSFNGLTATTQSGSGFQPVSEVANGSTVTLLWNGSVVDTSAYVIWYSTSGGQRSATPVVLGEWTSPPLTSDTVFTVVVTASAEGGAPLTASLSTAVVVQNPDLVAHSVTSGPLTVTGASALNGTATVTGPLTVSQTSTLTGDVSAGGNLGVTGSLTAASATVNGPATVGGNTTVTGTFSASGAVGIGTTTPATPLEVYAPNSGAIRVTGSGGGGTTVALDLTTYVPSPGTDPSARIITVDDGTYGNSIAFQTKVTGQMANMCTTRMWLDRSGNVGIGTEAPAAPLHISANAAQVPWSIQDQYSFIAYQWNSSSSNAFLWGLTDRGQTAFVNTSILAEGQIVGTQLNAYSDERMKRIGGRSDGANDLNTLLAIEITDYHYKDSMANGTAPHRKVVGQQIERIFPQAVQQRVGVIPDIYQPASIAGGWVALSTDLQRGERVKLLTTSGDAGVYEVLEVTPDAFRTAFTTGADAVFVFGREVNDLRTVDYEAIAMLHVSATQQLKKETDTKLQALQDACDTLVARVRDLEDRLTAVA